MQPTQKLTSDLPEGIYRSVGSYVYVLTTEQGNLMERTVRVGDTLDHYSEMKGFNPHSIFALQLVPSILGKIPDDIVISNLYPELFI